MAKKYKILVVEDELKLQKALDEKILREGWEVDVALDGKEGLRKVKKGLPDLILLDLRMPRMTGFEMLKELRKEYDDEQLPVIILTNYGEEENINKALKFKAEIFLVKANYSLNEIIEKIKTILEKK